MTEEVFERGKSVVLVRRHRGILQIEI
jgi:hypothetical protein